VGELAQNEVPERECDQSQEDESDRQTKDYFPNSIGKPEHEKHCGKKDQNFAKVHRFVPPEVQAKNPLPLLRPSCPLATFSLKIPQHGQGRNQISSYEDQGTDFTRCFGQGDLQGI
jgi:hypothetical protein